jgi:hypothetical protein
MTSTFDSTGITLDRYADTLAWLVEQAEAQWGEGIDTSEEEFYGHLFRLLTTVVAKQNEIIQSIYDGQVVSNSDGALLDGLVELIGLERISAAYSTVTLTLTATAATVVPAGTQYKTAANVVFATDTELTFTGAGSQDVAATCTVTGPNDAAIGEVNTIVNSVYGITTVTNAAAATPGRNRETAAELKERHTTATATSGEEDTASIYEAISGVDGVSSVYVFDNDTDEAVGGVPARTLHCSVIGGTDADIAAAIAGAKTSTIATYGATTVSHYNTTTRQTRDINFDRAVNTDTHIEVTIQTVSGVYPDDGDDQLKAALVAHYDDIRTNDDVKYNALYRPIYSIPGLTVTALKLDTSDPPTGTSDLTSSALIRYTLDEDDIDIVKV